MDEFTIEFEQASPRGVAQISRSADDQVEHRLRIARRGRHRLEHIDRGGLMFDALAEFAVPRRQFGAALVELALEFRDRLLGIGRIFRRCCFSPSPSMGDPGTFARTRTRCFLHYGSVLGITPTARRSVTPTPALPHRGGGSDRRPARTGEESITPSTSVIAVWCSSASS